MTSILDPFAALVPVARVLPNGLRVEVAPLPHLRTTAIRCLVGVGARFESPTENGLSHLLEHMLFRGTRAHPTAHALTLAFESLGASLDATTHADFTAYDVTLPASALEPALAALSELVEAPLFIGLDVEKKIVREEILEGLDEDGREIDADDLVHRAVFGAHPLGQPLAGPEENLDRFTTADLVAWHRAHHGAKNLCLVVAGPVDPETTHALVARLFGRLPPGERKSPLPAAAPMPGPRLTYVDSLGSQTDLRIAIPTFGQRDARARALDFLVRTLDGGMSARLFQTLALERGLVYDAFADLDLYADVGLFVVGAACDHKTVPAVVETALGLVRALRDGPVTAAELETARRRFLFELESTLDDARGVAAACAERLFFETDETFPALAAAARSVGLDDLRAAAKAALLERHLQVVAVGVLEDRDERALRALLRAPD